MGWGRRALESVAWLSLAATLLVLGCGRSGKRPQVVVIGLDGATWEILQPWIDRGDLPTLAALQRESAWGELQSSVPFLSPPAWTTAVTGVNPGKHAIYDFERRLPQSIVIVNEDAKSRRAQPVWTMLQNHARRSLLLNIPMTDPPDEVLGLCVAGFPHLDKTGYTFPPELQQKLGDYPLDAMQMKLVPGTEDSLLAVYREALAARRRVAIDWLRNEPFDLFWMVFTDTDRIQHTFWVFMDPESPNYDPQRAARYGTAIHDYWVEQDRALGDVLAAVPAGATALVLSDHGFGPIRYDLKLQNLMRMPGSGMTAQEADGVYVLDPSDAARIYVARRGRDPGAVWSPAEARRVRDKLATLLRNTRDPRTGASVCERVMTNEDLFHGTYAEKGPDLVVLPAAGYFMTFGESNAVAGAPAIVPHGPLLSAWHRMNGIYAWKGPGIAPGRRDGDGEHVYSLLDVAPTVLYMLDEGIPYGLDGTLMRAVIDPALLAKRPPASAPALEEDIRERTPEELEQIKKLESLPYVGS
jgi:predicted AlkP superfamily phosphohydrolase/phosphomutase